jgi:hypothetical protein
MRTRAVMATCIAGGLFAAYLASSGGPTRVHIAVGIGLLLGFWLPALLVRRPGDLRRRSVLAVVALGAVALGVGNTITVAKAEFPTGVILALASIPVLLALLAVHGSVVQRATRRRAV